MTRRVPAKRCEHRDQHNGAQCKKQALEDSDLCYSHSSAEEKVRYDASQMAAGRGRVTKRRVCVSFHLYPDEETNGYLDRLRATFNAREGLKIEVKEEVL